MLNNLRNFSKGKLAGVLVGIIIIPFVFWGMGSVFSGGNTNSVAKINNHNISTKDFINFINESKINPEIIKQNLNNNILEELLTQLVSASLIDIEIDKLNVSISDRTLASKIKNQKSFKDNNGVFSRIKYEKFLLENNMSVVDFEEGIKKNELKKKLFIYISGGLKSPYFLTNKTFKDQTKNIEIEYINLNNIYTSKNAITKNDINDYVNKNKDKLSLDVIDISYVKLTPETLTQENEFTENFFSKIDEIENLILNNSNITSISKKFNLNLNLVKEYKINDNDDELLKEIYKKRNENQLQIIDKNDYFLLYSITNSKKILPNLNNDEFLTKIKNDIFEKNKYELHKEILNNIQNNKFTDNNFLDISNGKIENLTIESIEDDNKFSKESINILYSLSKNSFALIADEKNNIYLTKIKQIIEIDLKKNSKELVKIKKQTNDSLRDNLYSSYDLLLNNKYKIKVNENTLDRIKNYFK